MSTGLPVLGLAHADRLAEADRGVDALARDPGSLDAPRGLPALDPADERRRIPLQHQTAQAHERLDRERRDRAAGAQDAPRAQQVAAAEAREADLLRRSLTRRGAADVHAARTVERDGAVAARAQAQREVELLAVHEDALVEHADLVERTTTVCRDGAVRAEHHRIRGALPLERRPVIAHEARAGGVGG